MRRDEPLPADFRANAERPAFSRGARIELAVALIAIFAFIQLRPALEDWIGAHADAARTAPLAQCRPPAEHEQLHVVLLNRAGELVFGGCLYAGSEGTYRGAR